MSETRSRLAAVLFPLLALLVLWPRISAGIALVAGILLALTLGNPFQALTRKWTHTLLALSVVGLGAGMDLRAVAKAGLQGLGYTVVSISASMALGLFLARRFRLNRDTGLLVTVGTAICGGSAIAAVAPVIQAEEHDTSVALATVFLLNAVALLLFPVVGHGLHLSQHQFGLWAALAIHDTSSVVGAAMQYGPKALEVATTVKLARALWIVPLTMAVGAMQRRKGTEVEQGRARRPWFILGFIAAAALVTWVPALRPAGHVVAAVSRQALVLTLFIIGANLTRSAVRAVGVRPLAQGVGLWVCMAGLSLGAIALHLIA